jgi:hypothetical protein
LTDPLRVELNDYRLADHQHQSGCPANPERQEAMIVRKPSERGLVPAGVAGDGEQTFKEVERPGREMVKARCCDCGVQQLFEIGAPDGE